MTIDLNTRVTMMTITRKQCPFCKWAFCLYVRAGINTNMFLEAFQRKLKTVYENKTKSKNRQVIIYIIEDCTRMKLGNEHRKCEIVKRCSFARKMRSEGVKPLSNGDDSWFVQSSTRSDVSYTVTLITTSCDCQLNCCSCGACVHMYICSCVDNAVH